MHLTRTGIFTALLLIAAHCSWASSPSSSDDKSWYPRTIQGENGAAIIQAPQIDAWQDFETITGWAAFQVTGAANDDSYYGSLKFNAQTDTDIAAREVLGKQEESNREYIVTYVGDNVFAVKWRTLKVHFYTAEGTFAPIVQHTFPQVFDIRNDPGETRELWAAEGY